MASSTLATTIDMRSLLDPQWRYHNAIRFADDGVVVFDSDVDNHVVRLTSFIEAWRTATPEQQVELETVDFDVYWAYNIFVREYRGPRFHIDALVVADMPTEEIANYLSLPASVVETYELCFFDLRRHLNKTGAVRTYIGSRIADRGNRDLDPDPFWKQVALSSGADALLALWSNGELEPAIQSKLDNIVCAQVRRRALQAVYVRDVNSHNAHDVMAEYLELRRTEVDAQRAVAETGTVQGTASTEFVAALLTSVQLLSGANAAAAPVVVDSVVDQAVETALVQRIQSVGNKDVVDDQDTKRQE